ncbi:MAG TPA: T9SS type A sorting domain-containing protein, partial [Balneolales bacterium]|nr:T9SS type A sorting domain-containing protein [Balneolales bacterium]
QQPSNFKLAQNYPNPFNPSTNISYTLPVSSKVTLTVYDIMGRKVAQLISDAIQGSGNHVLTFKADNLASGTYFYRLEAVPQSGNAGQFTQTRKMILLK